MRTHKNIYALLIAIDAYPPPVRGLNGCIHDLKALQDYLKANFNNNNFTLHTKTLINEQATRQEIIDGFGYFDQAQEGDVCLFHFSGHGSQQPAPEAFWHLESDHQVESILCYDSRLNGGKDLIDKEISYLIWKANKDKNIHFIVLMDCCHAGTNTRLEAVNMRMEKAGNTIMPVESYLGFSEYKEVESGRFTPPRGRHIHLAACKADETAKEVYVDDKTHGVFTYALLETLKSNGNNLSYLNLAERLHIKVKNIIRNQAPQLETTLPEDKWTTFLTGEPTDHLTHYLISYASDSGWTVNAGALHGFQQGNILQILDEKTSIEVMEILPAKSKVSGMEDQDPTITYTAIVIKRNQPKAVITFAANADAMAKDAFYNVYKKNGSDIFDLVEDTENATYKIRTKQNQYFLTLPNDERPIFIPVSHYVVPSAIDFINKVEKVIKWQRLLELGNPPSSIREPALELTFWRLTEPGQYEDNTSAEEVNWQETIHLSYHLLNGKSYNPAFRLKIKNRDSRTLWVSALYLGDDFSVQNVLLPKEELQAGAEVWLADIQDDYAYRSIMTKVDDKFFDRGITHTLEFIKIIVSTEEIDTHQFNQKGFYDEILSPSRALSRRDFIYKPDWRTYEIKLQTTRPMPWHTVNEGNVFHRLGIRVALPNGCSAKIRLATLEEIKLLLGVKMNIIINKDQYFTPYEFSHGLNYTPGLSIIAFTDLKTEILYTPISIIFDKIENEIILPLGYNAAQQRFFILKHTWQHHSILLEELPPASVDFCKYVFFHLTSEL